MKIAVFAAVLVAISIVPAFAQSDSGVQEINYKLSELFTKGNDSYGIENSSDLIYHTLKIQWINDLEDGITIASNTDYSINSPDYGIVHSTEWKFDSGELKLGDVVTYIFDKPGWYAYSSKSYPDVVHTVRIYDTETQCSLTGCGLYLVNPSLSELSDEIKTKAADTRKQIQMLEMEIKSLYTDNGENGKKIENIQKNIDLLEQEIRIMAKNDPNCIDIEIGTNKCIYTKPSIIENLDKDKLPKWLQTVFSWYDEGKITEDEFLTTMKYLMSHGLLV